MSSKNSEEPEAKNTKSGDEKQNSNIKEKIIEKDFHIEEVVDNKNGVKEVITGKALEANSGDEEVFLRIYDLSRGFAKQFSQQILGFQIDGVWHTSIEIFGNEYYFQNGLLVQKAGTTHYEPCVERISLGRTICTKPKLEEFFETSKGTWTPESYNLFENNCNNFSDLLSHFLVEKGIPSHIIELPEKVKKSPMYASMFKK